MKSSILVAILGSPSFVFAQFGGGGGNGGGDGGGAGSTETCSDNVAEFSSQDADTDSCLGFTTGNTYLYPDDFPILNSRTWYECPESGVRIVVSNNIPDHDVTIGNPNAPCVIPWHIRIPLYPEYVETLTEPSALGLVGVQLNGVGVYGAKEGGGTNAVEPLEGSTILDAQYWYGHSAPTYDWHYHHPQIGYESAPSSDTLMGYAMDGFGIYGPLEDDSVLDDCNGITVDGEYRYHVRSLDQVDENGDYCDGDSPAVLWRYVVGCYHGDISAVEVLSSDTADIPDDCVVVESNDSEISDANDGETADDSDQTAAPTTSATAASDSADLTTDGTTEPLSTDANSSGVAKNTAYLAALIVSFGATLF